MAEAGLRRILVADDNKDAADMLRTLLGLLGNEVQAVYDGQAVLDAVPGFQPDVVLLDIGMPVMDGYETARRLRTEYQERRLVLIALTGWSQDEDIRRSTDAGFDAHLVKPVELSAIEELLGKLF